MKRQLLSALILTIATTTVPSTAAASSLSSGDSLYLTRLERIDSQSKSIDKIQQVRQEYLDRQNVAVNNVAVNNMAVDSVQEAQLEQPNRRMAIFIIAIALRLLHPLLWPLSGYGTKSYSKQF